MAHQKKKKSAAKSKPKATAKRKRKKNPNLLVIAGNPGVSVGSLVHQVDEDGRPGRRAYRVVRVLPAEQPGPGILWAMPARAQLVRDDGRDGGEVPLVNLVPARGKNPGRSGATGSCHACHVDDHSGCHGGACSCWCSGTTRVESALGRRGNPGPWDPNDWPPMNAERAAAAEQQKNHLRRLLVEELGLAFAAGRRLISVSPTLIADAGADQYTSPEVGAELVHEQIMNASIPQLTQYVAEARGMPSAHRWTNPGRRANVGQDEAAVAWRSIVEELNARLGDVRPKLKDYEGHMLVERARGAVLGAYESAGSAEELRQVALRALGPLNYRKGSPFARRQNPGAGIPRGGRSGSRVVGEATIEEAVRVHGAKKVANAQKRARKFHGREAERAVVVRVPDGKKKVTKKLVVAMGLVPETVYQVPGEWGSSKGDHVYQHDHPATKPPIKVLDPETNLTMDLPQHPDARITDWMYQ